MTEETGFLGRVLNKHTQKALGFRIWFVSDPKEPHYLQTQTAQIQTERQSAEATVRPMAF